MAGVSFRTPTTDLPHRPRTIHGSVVALHLSVCRANNLAVSNAAFGANSRRNKMAFASPVRCICPPSSFFSAPPACPSTAIARSSEVWQILYDFGRTSEAMAQKCDAPFAFPPRFSLYASVRVWSFLRLVEVFQFLAVQFLLSLKLICLASVAFPGQST